MTELTGHTLINLGLIVVWFPCRLCKTIKPSRKCGDRWLKTIGRPNGAHGLLFFLLVIFNRTFYPFDLLILLSVFCLPIKKIRWYLNRLRLQSFIFISDRRSLGIIITFYRCVRSVITLSLHWVLLYGDLEMDPLNLRLLDWASVAKICV